MRMMEIYNKDQNTQKMKSQMSIPSRFESIWFSPTKFLLRFPCSFSLFLLLSYIFFLPTDFPLTLLCEQLLIWVSEKLVNEVTVWTILLWRSNSLYFLLTYILVSNGGLASSHLTPLRVALMKNWCFMFFLKNKIALVLCSYQHSILSWFTVINTFSFMLIGWCWNLFWRLGL